MELRLADMGPGDIRFGFQAEGRRVGLGRACILGIITFATIWFMLKLYVLHGSMSYGATMYSHPTSTQ